METKKLNNFYFQHDCNARTDEKVLKARAKFGNIAYAWFFMLLEYMAETSNGKLSLDGEAIGGLSLGLNIPNDKLKKFIDYAIRIDLFKSDEKNFWSERMLTQLHYRYQLKKWGKQGAIKRWKNLKKWGKQGAIKRWEDRDINRGANGGANGGGNATPNAKERRGEERKEEESNKKIIPSKVLQGKPVTYGNANINSLIKFFKERFDLSLLDGSEKKNRHYCWLAMKKFGGAEKVHLLIDTAADSDFWGTKISSFMDLYYKGVRIISETRKDKSKIAFINPR